MSGADSGVAERAVALSSGGKDSILALHMAAEAGYTVVGLLTVLPQDPESPLYHTHNVGLVGRIARSLRLLWWPVRAAATDEEGALLRALQRVRARVVVTGGIASAFQGNRFARIASAVGARVISPLWGLSARQVYDKLLQRNIDAVIVAVAAYGLGPEWLGTHLTRTNVDQLLARAERYRFDATGEGGDLDTFVLDAPLYSRRLEIGTAEKEWKGDRGTLRIRGLRSLRKAEQIVKPSLTPRNRRLRKAA